jgi:ATP-dependent Clp protease ATP-binding subunit ClpA
VEKFMLQLEGQLSERHVAIALTPEARAWLAAKGYDPAFGARPLGRIVQRDVRDPLTDEILFGQLEHGGTVTIGAADDHLTFSYEPRNLNTTLNTGDTVDAGNTVHTEDTEVQPPKQ